MINRGATSESLVPIHCWSLFAGWVRIINGDDTIAPERSETVSVVGWGHAGCVRVENARVRAPPYITFHH
jgi:hypothetical protein